METKGSILVPFFPSFFSIRSKRATRTSLKEEYRASAKLARREYGFYVDRFKDILGPRYQRLYLKPLSFAPSRSDTDVFNIKLVATNFIFIPFKNTNKIHAGRIESSNRALRLNFEKDCPILRGKRCSRMKEERLFREKPCALML